MLLFVLKVAQNGILILKHQFFERSTLSHSLFRFFPLKCSLLHCRIYHKNFHTLSLEIKSETITKGTAYYCMVCSWLPFERCSCYTCSCCSCKASGMLDLGMHCTPLLGYLQLRNRYIMKGQI